VTASIILAHPYEKSFNHAIFHRVVRILAGNSVRIFSHDLYEEKFNPVLSRDELGKKPTRDKKVRRYSEELMESDLLFFVHPNWWGQPPAILKGYIDRVIRPPHAYDFDETDSGGGIPIGNLKNKVGIVFNTSNTEEERENNYFHDPLQYIWDKCVFGFCGIKETHRKMFRIVADSTDKERTEWLNDVEEIVIDVVKKNAKV